MMGLRCMAPVVRAVMAQHSLELTPSEYQAQTCEFYEALYSQLTTEHALTELGLHGRNRTFERGIVLVSFPIGLLRYCTEPALDYHQFYLDCRGIVGDERVQAWNAARQIEQLREYTTKFLA
jgi:hypothetical protein